MSVANSITAKLRNALEPGHLEVVNESHMHSVPPNSETHFKVIVVSEQFAGKRSVQRHQQIYGLLREELEAGVHALAIHTYTPDEWGGVAPRSPDCRGGSKP